jgi:photosystem II stability/assembly factor-like uncharacterized protein
MPKKFRRIRERHLRLAIVALVAPIILVALISEVEATTAPGTQLPPAIPGGISPRSPLASNSASLNPPVVATIPDPWLNFATNVNPGSSIDFISSNVGWKIDGRENSPHNYGQLATGVDGRQLQWPGDAVSATFDGGATWNEVISPSDGVWSIDLLNSEIGWSVGVKEVYATIDGGVSWKSLPELAAPLVSVAFFSSEVGVGINDAGQVLRTSDGGNVWSPVNAWSSQAQSACVSARGIGWISDSDSNVYATSDSGFTWRRVWSPTSSLSLGDPWSELTCNTSGDASLYIQYPAAPPSLGNPYVAVIGNATMDSWHVLLDNRSSSSGQKGIATHPRLKSPIAPVGSTIVTDSEIALVTMQNLGPVVGISRISATGEVRGGPPIALPHGSNARVETMMDSGDVLFEGITFIGDTAFAQLETTASSLGSQSCIFKSIDGGTTWNSSWCGSMQTLK